jgi:hypothetical protein
MDASSGALMRSLTDANLTTITPVNKPHPRRDIVISGSSRCAPAARGGAASKRRRLPTHGRWCRRRRRGCVCRLIVTLRPRPLARSLYLWAPAAEEDEEEREARRAASAATAGRSSFVFFDADPGPAKKTSKRGRGADDDE